MNENNRPKRPEEILAALSAEGNRIEQLTKEIDEKIYAFYGIQKQFIENGNLITAEHKKVLADLKNYKLPERPAGQKYETDYFSNRFNQSFDSTNRNNNHSNYVQGVSNSFDRITELLRSVK